MKVLSLFDGISCGQLALNRAGVNVEEYYSSEIELQPIAVTQRHWPDTIQLGDVNDMDFAQFQDVDLVMGGSPCQNLSRLTEGAGLQGDQSKLLFKLVEAIQVIKPRYFLLENVVPRKKEWKAEIDALMGVTGVDINSDLFVPQNRPRIYWTNIPIADLPARPRWNHQYYQYRRTHFRANKSGVCPCLTANMGTGGHNVPLHSEDLTDKLTPEECEALQALPYGYTSGFANSHRYKMVGNCWTVDVVEHIFRGIE